MFRERLDVTCQGVHTRDMTTTQTPKLVHIENVIVGMVNSCDQEIIGVRETAKSFFLTTISRVTGKPMDERVAKGNMIMVKH